MRRLGNTAVQYGWLALEAQQVIALRLMKLAMGGSAAAEEAHIMLAEKVSATAKAAEMLCAASARGTPDGGSDAIVRMLRRRVRANRERLTRSI